MSNERLYVNPPEMQAAKRALKACEKAHDVLKVNPALPKQRAEARELLKLAGEQVAAALKALG